MTLLIRRVTKLLITAALSQSPGAAKIGIAGIGMAPAFVALFLYSLLPVVSNTVVGLSGVSQAVREAARGLGMTPLQRLLRVEFPLAMPVPLSKTRIA